MNTDIEGSTALMRRVGNPVYEVILADHHRLIRSALQAHHGKEEGTNGDSFFATFTSPSACVAAALAMQRALGEHAWPAGEQLQVRMGIHTGEASEGATGLVGYDVHRAARIAAVAHGGQVLLSLSAAGLVEDLLPTEVELRDLGSHRLKDLGRPETLFQLVAEGLRTDFPPLLSLDHHLFTNNLPTSLNPFVGRSDDLAAVRALIMESRLVTLTGPGGSGKTRLALQVMTELIGASSDGLWFVELAPMCGCDADPVAGEVICQLKLQQHAGLSAADSLVATLRDQNIFIVLDNCEHVIDAVAELSSLIGRSCPKVTLVATSREPLGIDGERVYRVRPMSLPELVVDGVEDLKGSDAVELFVARVREHDSTFVLDDSNAAMIALVCRRLDGMPLAIELAASRLSSMSLEDLHDRLDQRFRLLTGGSRNALPRQQTLEAMVTWSYDLLTEPEREVLRRLSVFAGGFDLKAAETVCSSEELETADVTDLVSSLVNKSLVVAERSSTSLRYRMLESIRQYATEQLIQVDGETEAAMTRRQHAEYYLRLCEEAAYELLGPRQAVWLNQLDLEWGNVQATFNGLGSDPERSEEVVRLGVALTRFVTTRQNQFPIEFLRRALESGAQVGTQLRARALLALAEMTWMTEFGEQAEKTAFDLCVQAMELARELDDPLLEAEGLVQLSFTSWALDRRDLALSYSEDALGIGRRLGNPRLIGLALFGGGNAQPTPKEGLEFYREALINLRQAGDLAWACTCLVALSLSVGTYWEQVREGKALAEEAEALADQIGSTFHAQLLWTDLSVFCLLLGEVDEAESYGRRAIMAARRLGRHTRDFLTWNIFTLACCATSRRDFLRGAQLTGAHDAIQEGLSKPARGFWSSLEIEMRDTNRAKLIEALGEEGFERASAVGRGLTEGQVAHLALERVAAVD